MKLEKGDTIGIVALAGKCEEALVKDAISNLESLGYKTKIAANIFAQQNYLAGNDEDKIAQLYEMFLDPEVKLILNARGGYGSIKLINKIDYEIIKNNQKPFCGFSDITALLLMFYKKCGMITYHSPMLCSDFVEVSDFTFNYFLECINGNSLEFQGDKEYLAGKAEGILWGGNLSTVASLCGQDFIPEEDFIFFVEDLNEPVYKIDKMFQQLFNIDKFKCNCKGIILGEFLDIDNQTWLDDLFKSFRIPTVGGFRITHGKEKITLPIGGKAKLEDNILKIIY